MSLKMILLLLAQLCLCLTVSARDLFQLPPGYEMIGNQAGSSCGHQMAPADIAILLDSTFSIGRENWDGVKELVRHVANRVDYGPDQTRIATIRWSRKAKEVIGLDVPHIMSMFNALDGLEFRGGGGQVHKALKLLREKTFSQPRDNVARIGVLVIDEKSHNTPAAEETAEKLHQEGVKMIVIGVKRRRFDMDELLAISFDESRVILIDDIRDLNQPEVLDQLMDLICADANEGQPLEEEIDEGLKAAAALAVFWTKWTDWSACSASCGFGVKSRSRLCMNEHAMSSDECEGESEEEESCEVERCPMNFNVWTGPFPAGRQPSGSTTPTWNWAGKTEAPAMPYTTPTNPPTTTQDGPEMIEGHIPGTGTWSKWTSWSDCSSDCEKYRTRICRDPTKWVEMTDCEGSRAEFHGCNDGDCMGMR